ncbi:MAG TPA: hypothetical protein VF627_01635 [Abditibacterium sp.]|jgi:hypothetical protein
MVVGDAAAIEALRLKFLPFFSPLIRAHHLRSVSGTRRIALRTSLRTILRTILQSGSRLKLMGRTSSGTGESRIQHKRKQPWVLEAQLPTGLGVQAGSNSFFTAFSAIALAFVAANPALSLSSGDAALQNPPRHLEADLIRKTKDKR